MVARSSWKGGSKMIGVPGIWPGRQQQWWPVAWLQQAQQDLPPGGAESALYSWLPAPAAGQPDRHDWQQCVPVCPTPELSKPATLVCSDASAWQVWCGVVWCGVVWCGVVWCGVVWCGVVWCGVVWCGVVWCLHVCHVKGDQYGR